MTEDRRPLRSPDPLEARLGSLGEAIDWPMAPDLARRVTERLAANRPTGGRWALLRPARRALLVAVALLLLLAAAAVAVSFLVPGLRIVGLPPGTTLPSVSSPSREPGSLGARLGLGAEVDLETAAEIGGFEPLLPADQAVGAPDAVHVALRRINMLWRSSASLPETQADGVGLVVTQFRGSVDEGWYEKLLVGGATSVEQVVVDGGPAWWISGEPHQLVYRDERGSFVEETRRVVGDVLIWRRDGLTLRIESSLGRDATIRLAETFAPR